MYFNKILDNLYGQVVRPSSYQAKEQTYHGGSICFMRGLARQNTENLVEMEQLLTQGHQRDC